MAVSGLSHLPQRADQGVEAQEESMTALRTYTLAALLAALFVATVFVLAEAIHHSGNNPFDPSIHSTTREPKRATAPVRI
jgi:hypothetical protein